MLDRNEILRYMGATTGGDILGDMIDRAEKEVIAASRPKHVFKHIDIAVNIEKGKVNLAGTDIRSRDLAAHLNGCNEGFLFACTLGVGVDSLVKRYGLTEIYMLPVVQATAAAYTEFCADSAQKEIETYASRQSLYMRPRYSPGYGDFQLSCQKFIFDALQIPKNIGISLTDSFLMVPFKSVTAVIGLSSDPTQCHINKCMSCTAKNCPFRKENS
nr:vitamin B12 dependent-methionine synthase activation domain-containing protein [uncultured Acetatifactor sp.]